MGEKYKETKRKEIKSKEKNKNTYSMLLKHCNPELEGEFKGLDTCSSI